MVAKRSTGRGRGAQRHPVASSRQSQRSWPRWLSGTVWAALLVVLGFAGWQGLVTLKAMPVERISINGDVTEIALVEIEQRVVPFSAKGFIGIDLEALELELEAMPWVYRASVRRVWPDEIAIQLTQQKPIARWGDYSLLNHEAQGFAVSDATRFSDLPKLQGESGDESRLMQRYQMLASALQPLGLSVQQLIRDDIGEYRLRLSDGADVLFGEHDYVARLQRLIALYRGSLANRPVMRVDLRYEHGAAVVFEDSQWVATSLTTGRQR